MLSVDAHGRESPVGQNVTYVGADADVIAAVATTPVAVVGSNAVVRTLADFAWSLPKAPLIPMFDEVEIALVAAIGRRY